jgi:ABC-type polysaccharide/polyol phosphate transport system ATPase subunit
VNRLPVVVADRVSKAFVLHAARTVTVKHRVIDAVLGRRSHLPATLDALRDVSFTVTEGESVALIGRNGSGKSTLLKLIAGIHHATGGRLLVRAGLRVATMIELGVGFHPEMTGRENVYLNASIHGLSREQIDEIYPQVVAYAELERFIDNPIKTYSSGMVMRLGFATGISLDPDVFLLDEVFAVGDEAFQQKCLASMRKFQNEGRTMFFVSHSAQSVREMCTRALVLEGSRMVFDGGTDAALQHYRRLLSGVSTPVEEPVPESSASAGNGRTPGGHRASAERGSRAEAGERHLAFLRQQGVEATHRVLDLSDVTDLSGIDGAFDVVFASALLQDLPLEAVVRLFAAAVPRLTPGGRMFVAYFEAPSVAALEPIPRPGPSWSFFDQPPRHFDYETLARVVHACGGRAERLGDWGDPDGQMMMIVTRRTDAETN